MKTLYRYFGEHFWLGILAMVFALVSGLTMPLAASEILVAPIYGNDVIGDDAGVVTSLSQAVGLAAERVASGERTIVIRLQTGRHFLRQPVTISSENFPPGSSLTICGDANVEVSLGYPLDHWAAIDDGVWRCSYVNESVVPALYRDDVRLQPVRWPPQGNAKWVSGLDGLIIQPPPPPGEAELVTAHEWGVTRGWCRIESGMVAYDPAMSWSIMPELGPMNNRPLWFEHLGFPQQNDDWRWTGSTIEVAIDHPPFARELIASGLSTGLILKGTREQRLQGVSIEGITFLHGGSGWPLAGAVGVQAGHVASDALPHQVLPLPAAIHTEWVDGIRLSRLRIAAGEGGGIALGAGSRGVRIERCILENLGAYGVMIGWRGPFVGGLADDWVQPDSAPVGCEIVRSRISRCAQRDMGSVGIAVLFSTDIRITQCLVEDLPYSGISLGFRWDAQMTSMRGCIVAGNHIRRVMQVLSDGGGIYTLGRQPGTVIADNYIEQVGGLGLVPGAPAGGIFFDNGSRSIEASGNVLARITGEPLRYNGTTQSWLLLGNNTVVGSGDNPVLPPKVALGVGP